MHAPKLEANTGDISHNCVGNSIGQRGSRVGAGGGRPFLPSCRDFRLWETSEIWDAKSDLGLVSEPKMYLWSGVAYAYFKEFHICCGHQSANYRGN